MERFEGESLFKLVTRYVSLIRRFFSLEKAYVEEVAKGAVKSSLPALVLGIAGIVLVAISGIFILVTMVLVLNIWFQPWASALIVTVLLMLSGLVLILAAALMAKKGLGKTQASIGQIRRDMRWLKKSRE